ncbi:sugar ABC transporter substrate-binding protein [Microbacterium album]|uniref:Periplasmic binding protein domain-containing protein n=1 Tax=Microbacterium album TaxID=2053191 RepID=A0A917ICT2_9MICO|nr:substrate-binding domain-containing protein [Microbacterium album]GGH33629.1 hypothetical protein GCM10010921_00720 [Microbacterium album]
MINPRFTATVAALALTALTLAGCSSDEPPAAANDDSTPAVEISDEAQAALDRAYEGVGSTLEDLEPATPPEGVNFYVMSCGEQVPTCSTPAAAMVDAARSAGWNAQIVDGRLNPEGFATAIRQAIAGGADVLVPVGIGCGAAASAFAEAKAAGVTIVGGGGVDDCDPKVWDSERLWLENPVAPTIFHTIGHVKAEYAFGKSDGDVKAIVLNQSTNVWGGWITEAFEGRLEELGGGEVVEVIDVSDPEIADGSYLQKVTSALLANPEVNTLTVPTDGMLTTGLAAAITQAGYADQLTVIGVWGSEGAIDMIREGQPGITATVGVAQVWEAWGSIDTAIRILNGQDPAYIGQSIQVVDQDRNLPESGPYDGSIDWKSKFLEAWGK